jgi:hypothetical protein
LPPGYPKTTNLLKRRDQLTMGYFDNLKSGPLNEYKKILKMEKNYIFVILLLD